MFNANEDMFLQAFDSTPKLQLATQRKLELELAKVTATISNPNAEWDHRVQAIKHFRALVQSGAADSEAFFSHTLKSLEIPFQNNICDLRSQVVRETCITIAFLSCRLQQRFSRMAEVLLASLIKLIPNSAKIVSSSAFVALCFIIQSTHNSRLIPIVKNQLSISKSKEIHRGLCDLAERMVSIWPPQVTERHLSDFVEVLRLGIHNSDEMARQSARRAFNVFAEHFREPAEHLFNSLDQTRQRMLNNLNHGGGSTLSMNGYSSGSSNLLHSGSTLSAAAAAAAPASHLPQPAASRLHQPSASSMAPPASAAPSASSVNLVSRLKSSLTISSAAGTNGAQVAATGGSPSRIRTPTARSTSAIDVAAQRRARARAVYLSSMYTKPRQLAAGVPPTTSSSMTPTKPSHIPSPFNSNTSTSHLHHHHHQQHPLHDHQPGSSTRPQVSYHHHHHQHHQPTSNNNNHHHHLGQPSQRQPPPPHVASPNVAQQQQQLQHLQQQQAASAEKRDGVALSKAAAYLLSVISNNSISESQIVTTIKYFNSLIEKHPTEIVARFLTELMPPLVIGIDNAAICVRKASVFAMVAIHAKVGLAQMEPYLINLTMTQRKLLEVYIKKFKDENRDSAAGAVQC